MNENVERILTRIRKMLAIANDSRANEHEAMAAASHAESLMRKYQLDSADIVLEEIEQTDSFSREFDLDLDFMSAKAKLVPSWIGIIAMGCGAAFTCKVDVIRTPSHGVRVRFSGYTPDVKLASWVYRFLCEQVHRVAFQTTTGSAASKAFRMGAAIMLQSRLFALKKEREQPAPEATGNALVLFERKEQRVEEMFGSQESHSRHHSVRDYDAYQRGQMAGRDMAIPTNVLEGSRAGSTALIR